MDTPITTLADRWPAWAWKAWLQATDKRLNQSDKDPQTCDIDAGTYVTRSTMLTYQGVTKTLDTWIQENR